MSLAVLAEDWSPAEARVRQLAAQFAESWRRTLALAVELGEALTTLKAELGHGNWLPWVEVNFPLGRQMATNFMNLAANSQEIGNLPPDTTVTAALAWLHEQRRGPRELAEAGSVEAPRMPLLRFCQADLPTATVVTLILRVFFPDANTALDLTYGSGNFWDGSAHVEVTGLDLDAARGLHGVSDFRRVPYGEAAFDVVLFDPPHLADSSAGSIMGARFGTFADADLPLAIKRGCCEAWRVARLGVIVKVTDHVHGQRFLSQTDWVKEAIPVPVFDVVHQVRTHAMVDPKWEEQLSAYNNGSTYLIFRTDGPLHIRRSG